MLFETIQDSISSLARELLYRHYEELKVLPSWQLLLFCCQLSLNFAVSLLLAIHSNDFITQENKIIRDEMVKKMMVIVGEKLLLDSLTKLKYIVSYFGSILYLSAHLMITILRVNYARLVYRAMFMMRLL